MHQSRKGESQVLEQVRKLGPKIAAEAEASEDIRGLSPSLNEQLQQAGVFRMIIPKDRGGEGLNLLQTLRVIEELSRADGAAGWTGMVANGFNAILGRFPPDAVNEVLALSRDVLIRGALAPKGRLVAADGGYRISGQWPLASGSYRHNWVMAHAIVFDGERPKMSPSGMPDMKMVLVPADQARFLDTWDSVGMRGSASHDFVLDNVFVPEERTGSFFAGSSSLQGAVHTLPFKMITAGQHTAVCTGIALAALDDLGRLALGKRPAFKPNVKLSDDPVFRQQYGQLIARLDAARGAADWLTQEVDELAESGRAATDADIERSNSMIAWVSRECVEVVNGAFALSGSTAAYRTSAIQRRWRDVAVAAQHAAASTDAYAALAGATLDQFAAGAAQLSTAA